MRSVLIGAVESTRVVLQAMQEYGAPPALLATLPPDIGRHRHADYVDLAELVDANTEVANITSSSSAELTERLRALEPEVLFVVGWSQLVSRELRETAKMCVGFHPSLLPAIRGRGVLGWTIFLGLKETGATLFLIDDGTDSGPILAQERVALGDRETIASLSDKMLASLGRLIAELLARIDNGTARGKAQPPTGVSYCARRTAEDGLIDWTCDAATIDRLIRASSRPYAGAFTFTRARRATIWSAEPVELTFEYHAATGQIVDYRYGNPIVRCGDGHFLMITDYSMEDGVPLSGQARFASAPQGKGGSA